MLTGRAAQLRPDINYLHVRVEHLDVERTPKSALPGEFAAMLRSYGRLKNGELAKASKARNQGRDIPTSGQARRRAKAHRNAGLCMKHGADGYCPAPAMIEPDRCAQHLRHAWTRTRGKQYEGDTAAEDTGWVLAAG